MSELSITKEQIASHVLGLLAATLEEMPRYTVEEAEIRDWTHVLHLGARLKFVNGDCLYVSYSFEKPQELGHE